MAKVEVQLDGFVTVPRRSLQALAEWAYPVFAWGRIWAKLPTRKSRSDFWNSDDDLHAELEAERMAFLKGIFWKAEQEATRREMALDPSRGRGGSPSLELFAECIAEMDNLQWDTPLTPKEVTQQKRAIKAKKSERAQIKDSWENPTPETIIRTMTHLGDTSLFVIIENLASDNPEVKAKAQAEIPRLMAELGRLELTA